MELSQSDKRLCSELINTGLERECRRFVEQIQTIACEPIPPEQLDEPYREENGRSASSSWPDYQTILTITLLFAMTM